MLYYIHIQETIGDFNESIIWLRNVDYEEAVELIQNNSPAFCNNISFSIIDLFFIIPCNNIDIQELCIFLVIKYFLKCFLTFL